MPCRMCGADISGKCFNCGDKARKGKHYCDNCFRAQKKFYESRPTYGEMANANPGLRRNMELVYGEAKMVVEDRVPPERQICDSCAKKKVSF